MVELQTAGHVAPCNDFKWVVLSFPFYTSNEMGVSSSIESINNLLMPFCVQIFKQGLWREKINLINYNKKISLLWDPSLDIQLQRILLFNYKYTPRHIPKFSRDHFESVQVFLCQEWFMTRVSEQRYKKVSAPSVFLNHQEWGNFLKLQQNHKPLKYFQARSSCQCCGNQIFSRVGGRWIEGLIWVPVGLSLAIASPGFPVLVFSSHICSAGSANHWRFWNPYLHFGHGSGRLHYH